MKYSNTALKELSARYGKVLRKCAYLNAIVLTAAMIATPTMAAAPAPVDGVVSGQTISGETKTAYNLGTLGSDLTIENSTFKNNTSTGSGGTSWATGGHTLTVENSTFTENSTTTYGGATGVGTTGVAINISDSTFKNNSSLYDGGAVGVYAGAVITNSTFEGNTAALDNDGNSVDYSGEAYIGGGAISLGSLSSTSIGTITGTTFKNNKSGKHGGAIGTRIAENPNGSKNSNVDAKLDIEGTFIGNSAELSGGAIYNSFYADNGLGKGNGVTVSGIFENNTAGGNGGAIFNDGAKDTSGNNGGVMTVSNSTFTGNQATQGGAIYSGNSVTNDTGKASLTVKNSTFTGNKADYFGALVSGTKTLKTEIENTTFKGNEALEVGAVGLFGTNSSLKNVKFIDNKSTSTDSLSDGAGALFLGAVSTTSIDGVISDSLFQGNTSGTRGGAISTRSWYFGDNTDAVLDINNTTFVNNTAATNGGALDNFFYSSNKNANAVYIGNSVFESNTAANGGAIYNHGSTSPQLSDNPKTATNTLKQVASIEIANSTFTGNIATTAGGAIYNELGGTVTLSGKNVFSGNTAGGVANDIHNLGALNISGDLTLDGGITGTGSVVFDGDTNLTAALKSSASINGTVTGLRDVTVVGLVVENGLADGSYKLTSTGDNDFAGITATNTLYDFAQGAEAGEIQITKKSTEAITDSLTSAGADTTTAQTVAAITEAKPTTSEAAAVADAISTAAQTGDMATIAEITEKINPTKTPVVQQQSVAMATQIFNVTGNRMSAHGMGRNGGDVNVTVGPWIQGLYNKTHNTQGAGFDGYSQGFALGVDFDINEHSLIGFGYGYTASDVKSSGRKTQIYADNIFLYGKYQPNKWYIGGVANYGHANYKEQALLTDKYDVDTYAAALTVGYQSGIFDNYAGMRYTYITPDKHSNGLTVVDAKNAQVGTAVIGTKISKAYKAKGTIWKPELRLAATYDVKSDNHSSVVGMVGGNSSYIVEGKRLKRFAVEAGVGLTTTVARNLDITLNYDANLRSEQTSQTGSVKLKYSF